jgi:hypothetical protein
MLPRSAQQRKTWGWLDYAALLLPCVTWLHSYSIRRYLLVSLTWQQPVGTALKTVMTSV